MDFGREKRLWFRCIGQLHIELRFLLNGGVHSDVQGLPKQSNIRIGFEHM